MCCSLHYRTHSHTLSAVYLCIIVFISIIFMIIIIILLSAILLQASGSVFRRLHKRSASHGEELTSGALLSGSGSGAARSPSAKKASQKAVIKQKKLLFVHFAINRVHCRVTYKVGSCNYYFSSRTQTSRIWVVCPVLVWPMLVCPVDLQPTLLINSAVLWCAALWFAVLWFAVPCCAVLCFRTHKQCLLDTFRLQSALYRLTVMPCIDASHTQLMLSDSMADWTAVQYRERHSTSRISRCCWMRKCMRTWRDAGLTFSIV